MKALSIQNISKQYKNHVALCNIDISIPSGSIFGLLGPNGAGKTTLLRIINQIIKPDAGTIEIFGEKMGVYHNKLIGYLPEERGLYKGLEVAAQLMYFGQMRGLSKDTAKAKTQYWLKKLQISDWARKKVEDLSKGMAQKVQFINAVLHEPKLLILDEPFSGFDPVTSVEITDEILTLKESGTTIIFSTHRMETVEDLCDHIALIHNSRKVLDGSKNAVKARYQTDAFVIEHFGELAAFDELYQICSQETISENYYRTIVKMTRISTSNAVIKKIADLTDVRAFNEQIPSMRDIFLNVVNNE